jgi:hypothetical protein
MAQVSGIVAVWRLVNEELERMKASGDTEEHRSVFRLLVRLVASSGTSLSVSRLIDHAASHDFLVLDLLQLAKVHIGERAQMLMLQFCAERGDAVHYAEFVDAFHCTPKAEELRLLTRRFRVTSGLEHYSVHCLWRLSGFLPEDDLARTRARGLKKRSMEGKVCCA